MPEQPRPPRNGPVAGSPGGPVVSEGGWYRRHRARKKRRLARMSTGKRVLRRIGLLFTWLLGLLAVLATVAAIGVYSVAHVPSPDELQTNQTATLLYSDGSTMATIDGGENRTSVPLSQVPVHVRDAVIAAEDRGYYSEPGISVRGTLRAAINDIRGGSKQGGSTITQQYVKNAYLNSDQTLSRKLKELAISLKLSRQYSKDDVLESYLNTIYFGRNAYGIQAASEAYFGIPVSKLSVSQGALLAAVIKSPEYYDPAVTPAAAKDRWGYVVDGMVSTGKLTAQQRAALTFPAVIKVKSGSTALDGPLGLVWRQVKAELSADGVDPATINTKGLRIQTTIDKSAQSAAESAISQTLTGLTAKQKNLIPALTAVNPSNGAVLAYYGGKNGTGFDYANGYRPPGSSFKPYTLATALTQNVAGKKPGYALDSTFDGSYCVTIEATKICNDPGDEGVSGFTTLAFAMKVSLNTTYDGLADTIGPPAVASIAHAMGIAKTRADTGKPSLVGADGQTTFGIGIGDSDYSVRPLDQAVGFATIADGGVTHPAYFISKVTDDKGGVLFQRKDAGTRSLDPKVANDVGLAVKPVADWSHVPLNNGRESGSKTGTAGIQGDENGNNSDAWMVGYTPQVSAAVWVGSGKTEPIYNSSGRPEYGSDLPGHTWKLFMDTYLNGKPNMPLPTTQQVGAAAATPTTTAPAPSATSTSPAAPTTSASTPPPTVSTPPTTVSVPPSSTAPSTPPPVTTSATPTPKPTPTPSRTTPTPGPTTSAAAPDATQTG